jgi:hypothetical protein
VTEVVDALVARMEGMFSRLAACGDPARFFLGTYLRTTQAIGKAVDAGAFRDADWVSAWDVEFAELYLRALTDYRRNPSSVARPWRRAFSADPDLPPEAHVLLGMNAHINYDLPQSLLRLIPPADFADPDVLARRHKDHARIDHVLASRVAAEDRALQRAGGRRTLLDRLAAPANRRASRLFLREARRKVWATTEALNQARMRSSTTYAGRLADLEAVTADRVDDILKPGPVLLRLAIHGFGVTLPDV